MNLTGRMFNSSSCTPSYFYLPSLFKTLREIANTCYCSSQANPEAWLASIDDSRVVEKRLYHRHEHTYPSSSSWSLSSLISATTDRGLSGQKQFFKEYICWEKNIAWFIPRTCSRWNVCLGHLGRREGVWFAVLFSRNSPFNIMSCSRQVVQSWLIYNFSVCSDESRIYIFKYRTVESGLLAQGL